MKLSRKRLLLLLIVVDTIIIQCIIDKTLYYYSLKLFPVVFLLWMTRIIMDLKLTVKK